MVPEWIPKDYLLFLVLVSAVFLVLERLWPERRGQPWWRADFESDLFYLVFNGHLWAVITAGFSVKLAGWARGGLHGLGVPEVQPLLDGSSFWTQVAVVFVVQDFLQWCIHNLLHRVPILWRFHQVHHSVTQMDWAGNFRFHWMELVVYKTLQYLPLLWLGGSAAVMAVAVAGTAWGHFNHSNLRVSLGPLGYVFNSPRMHMWHHDASDEGGTAKNFGIVLSCWDFLFGTAYWPRERPPAKLGFPGLERLPSGFARLSLWPWWKPRSTPELPPPGGGGPTVGPSRQAEEPRAR